MEEAMAQRAVRPGWGEIVEGGGIAQPFLNQQGCVVKEVVYGDDMNSFCSNAWAEQMSGKDKRSAGLIVPFWLRGQPLGMSSPQ